MRSLRFFTVAGVASFAALLLAPLSAPVHAHTLVVKPDGTGDVASFQAGVDSLIKGTNTVDTLLVMPGSYDETLDMADGTTGGPIVCPGGPSSTSVRAIHFPTDASHAWRGGSLSIEGLAIQQFLREGQFAPPLIQWDSCWFNQGFENALDPQTDYPPYRQITGCDFRGASKLVGSLLVEHCRFTGATVSADPAPSAAPYSLEFNHCSFEGPADPAALVATPDGDEVVFESCDFLGSRTAIRIDEASAGNGLLGVDDCNFDNISSAAIERESFDSDAYLAERRPGIGTYNNHFRRCGRAIYLHGPGNSYVGFSADTILDCDSTAVEVRGWSVWSTGLVINRCGGSGVVVNATPLGYQETPPQLRAHIEYCSVDDVRGDGIVVDGRTSGEMPRSAQLVNCRVTRAGNDGIRIYADSMRVSGALVVGCSGGGIAATLMRASTAPLASALFDHNTLAGNDGPGWTMSPNAGLTGYVCDLSANLSVSNGKAGFEALGDLRPRASGNDSWLNGGDAYVGLPTDPANISLDPQLCDPEHDDFHLCRTSPCAPEGPRGQIGAFGVGCDSMSVAIDVLTKNDSSDGGAVVSVAILGSRYFDADHINQESVRFLGAKATGADGRGPKSQLRDVNRDGWVDLVMRFRRDDLAQPEGGVATLTGLTVDGAPFIGSEQGPAIQRGTGMAQLARDAPGSTDLRLGIDALTPNPATTTITVRFTLPRSERAVLELLDVAGRRVFSRDVGRGAGRYQLTVSGSERVRAGVYWLRLEQAGERVTSKLVVIR